jgi:anti-anti-sigma regulatory factor
LLRTGASTTSHVLSASVRTSGVIEDARGLGPHDHVCWAYDDPDDLQSRVHEFLAEGLERDQRVWYVAAGNIDTLMSDLRDLPGLDKALRCGAAQVASLDDVYPVDTVVEPAAQVQSYAVATEAALAAGFTGLRVAVEATPLVCSPRQLDTFALYEHLIDRYMTSQPFAAMCAYHRGELGETTIAQLACLHPHVNPGSAQFRLHAARHTAASLHGELDAATVELFSLTLDRMNLRSTGGELVIDATGLTFIDHRNLLALAEYVRRAGERAVLRTAWTGATRLIELLDLEDVRVEPLI